MFDRLKRMWKLSGKNYFVVSKDEVTKEELQALIENGKIEEVEPKPEGGFLGGYMTEHEIAQSIKETDLGWKKVYDKVRNLGKDTQNGS